MFGRNKRRRVAILTVLLEGPEQGYTSLELYKHINIGPGAIFVDLMRLEGLDFVTSYWGEPRPGAPIREETGKPIRPRFYQLTPTGRVEINKLLGRYEGI